MVCQAAIAWYSATRLTVGPCEDMSQTPLLNREQPPPAVKSRTRLLRYGLPLLVGGAIGILLDFFRVPKLLDRIPGQALLIGFIPALYVGILVHELGHLVAGLSTGFELRALMVGAFLLAREAQHWKVRVISRRILAGGLTAMVLTSADRLAHRYVRFVLGGPAASMVLLAITVLVPHGTAARVLFVVNLLIVLSACVPFTWRSHSSDGKVLLLLMRKGPAADRLAALLHLLAMDTQQIAPRKWPRALLEKLSIPTTDTAFLLSAIAIQYADALDGGDPERIAEAIERALVASPEAGPDVRRAFYLAASSFHGIFGNNLVLAEEWLEDARRVKGAVPQTHWDAKALGAIALAKGERANACECLTRYLAMLDRRPASGLIAAERARTLDLIRASSSLGTQ